MGRLIARLIAAQDGWARPLGDFNHRWLSALFRPIRPVKDFLNGVWLGHPLHAAATDIPIGTLLLDGRPRPAEPAGGRRRRAGGDDPVHARRRRDRRRRLHRHGRHGARPGDAPLDADGRRAAAAADLARTPRRARRPTGRSRSRCRSSASCIVTAGAYVGGDVVYLFGNMVSRHAFRGAGTKWIKLDTGDVTDLGDASRGDADQGQGRDQRPRPRPDRRHDLRPARRLRTRRRAARPGHVRRRLRRVPVARLALPGDATATSGAARPSTTSPPTRSAPPKAEATRSAAPAS